MFWGLTICGFYNTITRCKCADLQLHHIFIAPATFQLFVRYPDTMRLSIASCSVEKRTINSSLFPFLCFSRFWIFHLQLCLPTILLFFITFAFLILKVSWKFGTFYPVSWLQFPPFSSLDNATDRNLYHSIDSSSAFRTSFVYVDHYVTGVHNI